MKLSLLSHLYSPELSPEWQRIWSRKRLLALGPHFLRLWSFCKAETASWARVAFFGSKEETSWRRPGKQWLMTLTCEKKNLDYSEIESFLSAISFLLAKLIKTTAIIFFKKLTSRGRIRFARCKSSPSKTVALTDNVWSCK